MTFLRITLPALALFLSCGFIAAGEGPRERHQVNPEAITPHLKTTGWGYGHGHYRLSPGYSYYGYPGWFSTSAFTGGFAPEIGRSAVWMTAGSNSYFGGGFSTRQPIGDSPFVYGVAISEEKGQTWHSNVDFRRSTIRPSLEWHGERTSIYGAFSKSTIRYSRQ